MSALGLIHSDRITLLVVLVLGLLLGQGCTSDCKPDGSCASDNFVCDFSDDTCRPRCTVDEECAEGEVCVGGRFCRQGAAPAADAGSVDAHDGGGYCREGDKGCGCYPNQTCNFGLICENEVCADGSGHANQPCYGSLTCNLGLDCVRHETINLCRPPEMGRSGQACFAETGHSVQYPCRSVNASCINEQCLGGSGDDCSNTIDCFPGLLCDQNVCTSPGSLSCRTRSECRSGEFCCGESTTRYANPSTCTLPDQSRAEVGECFVAPASIFDRPCTAHSDCAPTPFASPNPSGISLCMPWSDVDGICSAPCDLALADAGCPAEWTCQAAYETCLEDDDCEGEGLRCHGANQTLNQVGRCQCGDVDGVFGTCAAMFGSSAPTCSPSADDNMFCKLSTHCVPPLD